MGREIESIGGTNLDIGTGLFVRAVGFGSRFGSCYLGYLFQFPEWRFSNGVKCQYVSLTEE
jgi:hypothetical protein